MDSTRRTRTRSDDAGWHSNPLGGLNQEVVPIRTAPTIGLQRTVSPLQQKECPVPGTMPPYPLIALDAQNVPSSSGRAISLLLSRLPVRAIDAVWRRLASIKANSA